MRAKILLEPHHKSKRVILALERLRKWQDWYTVIFSDEKRFNLDGPDGYKYYWHSIHKAELSCSLRPKCQKTVMVWGAISPFGKMKLVVIPGILDSEGYVSTLDINIPQFIAEHSDKKLVFMQDNAAVHTSRRSIQWFREKAIEVFPWPAKSPDLNPIENIWYLLSRKVYGGGKQYYSVQEITKAILKAWNEITQEGIIGLYDTMPGRLAKIFSANGEIIN